MIGVVSAPSASAIARAPDLLALARENDAWVRTGGKQGKPANFDGEDMRPLGAGLAGLKLTAMSAKGANMMGLDLLGCHLQGANLEGADLRGARLRDTDLRGARLVKANLTKADLVQADLSPLPLGARETPACLEKANLRYVVAQKGDLTCSVLDGADLRGCDLRGAKLAGASLRDVDYATALGFEAALAA